jgi:Flp pilus assembly pilin Flp
MRVWREIERFVAGEEAATMAEYALLAGLIAVACIASVVILSDATQQLLDRPVAALGS